MPNISKIILIIALIMYFGGEFVPFVVAMRNDEFLDDVIIDKI